MSVVDVHECWENKKFLAYISVIWMSAYAAYQKAASPAVIGRDCRWTYSRW